jgi:hypothetical protein
MSLSLSSSVQVIAFQVIKIKMFFPYICNFWNVAQGPLPSSSGSKACLVPNLEPNCLGGEVPETCL